MYRLLIISFSRDFDLPGLVWQGGRRGGKQNIRFAGGGTGSTSRTFLKSSSKLMSIWPPLPSGSGKNGGYGCSSKL
jgi:hypothetical protein